MSALELDLAPLKKLANALWMSIFDAAFPKMLMRLDDRGDLALLHDSFELFPRFIGDQLPGATLIYPADQQLIQATFPVGGKPPRTGASCIPKPRPLPPDCGTLPTSGA